MTRAYIKMKPAIVLLLLLAAFGLAGTMDYQEAKRAEKGVQRVHPYDNR